MRIVGRYGCRFCRQGRCGVLAHRGAGVSAWWVEWYWPVLPGLGCGVWVLTFSGEDEPTNWGGGFTTSANA